VDGYYVQLYQILPGPVYTIWNVCRAWITSSDSSVNLVAFWIRARLGTSEDWVRRTSGGPGRGAIGLQVSATRPVQRRNTRGHRQGLPGQYGHRETPDVPPGH
jgi:hypothetical protein